MGNVFASPRSRSYFLSLAFMSVSRLAARTCRGGGALFGGVPGAPVLQRHKLHGGRNALFSLIDPPAHVERHRAEFLHGVPVLLQSPMMAEVGGHRRSIVDDSLAVKNQIPMAIATNAVTTDVASAANGTSPTPMIPQRKVATTDAIGLT